MSDNGPNREEVVIGNRTVDIRLLGSTITIAAVLIFVLNTDDTRFSFPWLTIDMPMWGLALALWRVVTGWSMHGRRAERGANR